MCTLSVTGSHSDKYGGVSVETIIIFFRAVVFVVTHFNSHTDVQCISCKCEAYFSAGIQQMQPLIQ